MNNINDFIDQIHLGKWEDVLPKIPSNSVDIVISSPPYNVSLGVGNKHKKDKYDTYDDNMPYEDYLIWMDKLFTECYRVLQPSGRIAINIGDGANGCYDDKTQVLTKSGWIFFKDLSIEDDVITLNPLSYEVEWQKPTAIQKYKYNGDMHIIKHSRMDLMVTPNHRMFVEKHHVSGYFFEEASNLNTGQYYVPGAIGKCSDFTVDNFVLDSMPLRNRKNKEISSKQIRMEDFAEFLGWYISEGCCSYNQKNKFCITISQSRECNPDKHKAIINCIKRMGYHPHLNKNRIVICDKQLCFWLENNIKKYAENKNIPNFVMSLPLHYLEIFFNAMIDGDGCRHCKGQIRFYSSSRMLSEQMQAVGLRIGLISTLNIRERIGGKIRGRQIYSRFPSYEVTFSKRQRLWFNAKNITKEKYSGFVYCCSVPNTIIYVKRNNFSVWCGNSVPTHADFTVRMRDEANFIPMTTIVWDKKQIGASTAWGSYKSPSCPSFPTQFEFIIVMAKEMTKHEGDKSKITVGGKEFQRNSRALWSFPPETRMMELYGHPACFPEELPKRLLQQLTYEDDIVLDPFSGSGTTCVVAKKLRRKFIGIEMSEKYYNKSLIRLGKTAQSLGHDKVPQWME